MKKFKFKIKKEWKSILSAVLVGVLLFGAVSAAVGILNKDTKTISSTAFAVGGINDQGNYVESDGSIYTPELIECQGLTIEPDFEATGSFQVFYYDEDKNFLSATDELKASDGVYNKADTYILAKYCRIVITPEVPMDDDGNVEEDFKIRFYEVVGYADDYTITVNKNQKYSLAKVLKSCTDVADILGEGLWVEADQTFTERDSGFYFFNVVDVEGKDTLIMKVATETLSNIVTYNDNSFGMPMLYECGGACISHGTEGIGYSILESNSEVTYISYNVSAYSSVVGCVDSASVDILEIYVQ